jgi:hypothetical protein
MKRSTIAIVVGAVALILVFVTLLTAAGLWMGVNLIRREVNASGADGPIARLASGNWDDRPYGPGHGGPGMMWGGRGWGGAPLGSAQDMPCDSAQDMPCDSTQDMPCGSALDMPCAEGSAGSSMMWAGQEAMPCGGAYVSPEEMGAAISLEEAAEAVERYVERLGYTGLHLTEVMEFEHNFYAIVAEEDTGIGAMELLVNKGSGAVGPEPGPNMMWNSEYGMHRGGRMGMMGGYATGEMTLSAEEAEEAAQRWLDANLPGREAGEADPFYGYYTLHYLKDGEIEGMLSVHGSSGDVWYHSWHGEFIAVTGDHG